MIIRIKLRHGRTISRASGKNRHLALGAAALLTPLALMAYVLAFWRLASDAGVAGDFAIGGIFSHWQIWMAAGVVLHVAAWMFNRYGRGLDLQIPRIFTLPSHRARPDSHLKQH